MRKLLFLILFMPIFLFGQNDIKRYVEEHIDSNHKVVWYKSDDGIRFGVLDSNNLSVSYMHYSDKGIRLFEQFNLDSLSIRMGYDSSGMYLTYFSIQSCMDTVGLQFRFLENGSLYAIQQGIGDQYQNGFRRWYNEDGSLQVQDHYSNGMRYGTCVKYGENGNLEKASYFDWHGGEKGDEVYYHTNGNFRCIVEVVNGLSNGRVYMFDEQCDLISIAIEANGEFVEWVYKRN